MDVDVVLNECDRLLKQAHERFGAGFPNQGAARLSSLRDFLIEQPELEAGGACESDESSNGS